MTNNVENLLLEHMKRFQSALERIEHRLGELTTRVSAVETGLTIVGQQLVQLATADAAQQVSIDRINDRLDRIERRLELAH